MMSAIRRVGQELRANGLIELCLNAIPTAYDQYIRYFSPKTGEYVTCSGIRFAEIRWLDHILPNFVTKYTLTQSDPEYETALLHAIREVVDPGDKVLIIGGGRGISTVVAREATGPDGSVVVYEASKRHTEYVERTLRLNDCKDGVMINHALVGEAIRLRGQIGEAKTITPAELTACDVMSLDCEGIEDDVIRNMDSEPRQIIAETHPPLGTSTEDVIDALDSRGYSIDERRNTSEGSTIELLLASRKE